MPIDKVKNLIGDGRAKANAHLSLKFRHEQWNVDGGCSTTIQCNQDSKSIHEAQEKCICLCMDGLRAIQRLLEKHMEDILDGT